MTWIEDFFGISPDGGNGMFEALLLVAVALILFAALVRVRRVRSARRDRRDE
jgi:hypothetical protein